MEIALKRGDHITVSMGSMPVDGIVLVASENGKSLMIAFDSFIGGYLGMMPLLYDDKSQEYRDLIEDRRVIIKKVNP